MPRHRLFTTHLTNGVLTSDGIELEPALLAALSEAVTPDCRFPPSPPRQRQIWGWPAAFLLHAAIIALALISFKPRMSIEPPSPSGVSVVFENTGSQQSAAPPAPFKGPPTPAQAPAATAPPPPQATVAQEPEVNLNLPEETLAPLSLPPPAPQAQTRHVQHVKPAPRQYQVMNNMSLGSASPATPNARHGINLQLNQSDLNAMDTPEITVQGQIGQDWMDGFNKWVNDHTYYPQEAVEEGQQGTSMIQFTVHRDGSITGLHLLSSAGSTFLDQAWLGIFAQNNVPAFPAGTKSDTIKITATLHYELVP